jgi:hypothetical protein
MLSAESQNSFLPYQSDIDYDMTDGCCESSPYWGTFSVKANYLYWQPVVTGMAYSLTRTNKEIPFSPFGPDPSTVPDNIAFQNVKFDYAPGYRVGGRYTLSKTQLDADVDYTCLKKTAKASVLAWGGVFIDTLWDALNAVNPTEARSHFKIDYQVVNACIGKTVSFCDCFSIRPNIGAQWYNINCIEEIQYIGVTIINNAPVASNANIQLMNKTQGWGLVGGLDLLFELPYNFGFFGTTKCGISKSDFRVSQNQQTNVVSLQEIDLNSTSKFHAVAYNIDVKTGLDWNYQFNFQNHSLNVNLFIAYEMSLWLQNIQISRVLSLGTGFSDANTTNIGNLGFRGLTTGFIIGF